MSGIIRNGGCVSAAMRRDLANRGKNGAVESFFVGRDLYTRRADGSCWLSKNKVGYKRIKNAVYETAKAGAIR